MPAPVRRRRTGLLIAGVIVLVLLVAGGAAGLAGYLLLRDDSKGQATSSAAVTGFLDAVYNRQDAGKAARYVCAAARDENKLAAKIDKIRKRDAALNAPRYTWSTPKVEQSTKNGAILTTTVTERTGLEQQATQSLRFVTVEHNGWWVCEVRPGG